MPAKRTQRLTPEVQSAVNDILNGTDAGTHTEWLQREYGRLMLREARMRREMNHIESKLKNANAQTAREADNNDDGVVAEQP